MDRLLEHFMPSLMDLKKVLPGIQPESFRESCNFVVCFYKVLKKYRGELKKLFQKEKRLEGYAL